MSFVHLHRHSEFSRLDGLGTAKQYADRAAELGMGALAQTDHGTVSGALHHIEACRKAGIMPISGVEAYFRPNRSLAKKFKQRQAWHLCLFAKDLKGWHNLLRICSVAYGNPDEGGGFYQYPCVDFELLRRYSDGLACSSACVASWLNNLIKGGDSVAVNDYITQMTSIFGEDFWLEIMPHDFDEQRTLNLDLVRIANERSIPIVATNDTHFPYKEWADTHRIAKIAGSSSSFAKAKKDLEKGKAQYLADLNPTLYLAHEEEMRMWFSQYHPDLPENVVDESIKNTELFVSKMKPFLLDKNNKLPKVTESAEESEKIMHEWIEDGLSKIYERDPENFQIYDDRVKEEWEILKSKGVFDYFVMVGDVCRWARSVGIRVGLGRGSAAGCLISYLIGITAIDPISYGLLFERFLNPSRKGLPDIDLDFDSERRGEVKAYIARKYGEDHVADIITHMRFQPKSALQDVCRVYDIPYDVAHAVTDTIEIRQDDEETTLEELFPLNDKLQEFAQKYPDIWEHAKRLEGSVRNIGKHAAGIIITPSPVVDFMALERGKKGDLVTSWSDAADFPVVSDYGFVKLDALGIKGLTKHDYACRLIEKRTGERLDLNSLEVLYDPEAVDQEVMEGFRKGYTIGVFQFGGRGITSLLKEIQPDSILDITAANALYRPGPMKGGVHQQYAKRKHDPSLVSYWHDLVEPVLSETYGIVAYQEQVMEISKQIGGFSAAEADDLRKAMGKLYRIKGGSAAKEFMGQFEEKWFAGAESKGLTKKVADEIWHKILEFGHYGFNKSHSASYALQAYQDMFLKMKYPLEFYAAFLTYEDDDDKKKIAIREARARGIKILPPDVNTSGVGWTVDHEEQALRFGLLAINGIGEVGSSQIIKERSKAQYGSMENLSERCPKINKSGMDALRESGAFDCFGGREGASQGEIAVWEKERLKMSLTVSADSMKHGELIKEVIYSEEEIEELDQGARVVVGGEISKVEVKKTKKGDPFANVTIVFDMNEWRVKFWKQQLARFEDLLTEGNSILVAGSKNEWNGTISIVASTVTDVETYAAELNEKEEV